MARTLSDTIIIAMVEAATRLASGRGPIAGTGSGGSVLDGATQAAPAAGTTSAEGTGVTTTAPATPSQSTPSGSSDGPAGGRSEHDTRSAAQIGNDFKAIYTAIEEVVKTSAEQETKSVGFCVR
jgi:hypothetical protein